MRPATAWHACFKYLVTHLVRRQAWRTGSVVHRRGKLRRNDRGGMISTKGRCPISAGLHTCLLLCGRSKGGIARVYARGWTRQESDGESFTSSELISTRLFTSIDIFILFYLSCPVRHVHLIVESISKHASWGLTDHVPCTSARSLRSTFYFSLVSISTSLDLISRCPF